MFCILLAVAIDGVMVSVPAIGTKVRGFKPSRERWIFKADKNSQHNYFGRGSKVISPHDVSFTAC
jgi:hypothetical protein